MKTKRDMFYDISALIKLQRRIGGAVIALPGDAPMLTLIFPGDNSVQWCNVTGEDGDYDLWVDGSLKLPGMTLAEAEAWIQVRK